MSKLKILWVQSYVFIYIVSLATFRFFLFFLAVLGIKLRVLHFLGWCCIA
jgi:hypothetical protein